MKTIIFEKGTVFMKQHHGYILQYVNGTPHILPYGQNITEHKRGVEINETGVVLWNMLAEERPRETIIENFLNSYDVSEEDKKIIQKDAETFFTQLWGLGMIDDELRAPKMPVHYKTLKIAGLTVTLSGAERFFSKDFDSFESNIPNETIPDLCLNIYEFYPPDNEYGNMILHSDELCIYEQKDTYTLMFPKQPAIKQVVMLKDGSKADFYCLPPYSPTFTNDIFHAIRFVFLYTAQAHNIFAIHSASILYRDKAWLFTGPSGTGKSTHTNLWKELYNTPIINGDLNLLEITKDGLAVVHGLPWCGTSGISDTKSYPLGGVVILKQDKNNRILELSPVKQTLGIMHRLISPVWTSQQLITNLNFSEKLSSKIMICRLYCTKDDEAAKVMRQKIDNYLDLP